jgi:cytochrome P450
MIYGMVDARRAIDPAAAPHDVLQMLLGATDHEDGGDGAGLTATEVRDHLVTLFLAGHETTSHALTWALYLLSQHRDAWEHLTGELDAVLGDRMPGYEDLDALPYTEAVMSEAMRLYPPAYMVARRAIADTEIGGYPVPAGAEVVAWIYMTHRDPRWYPQPLAFRPERFAPEARAALPKMAYLPFGGGPRACIGAGFAMVEARLILATLACRYRFELEPGHRVAIQPRITLVPKGGMPMIVRARTRDRAPRRGH